MSIISTKEIACREWSMQELVSAMQRNMKCWSWGIRNYVNFHNQVLRFRVSGHHHKGYVFISLNFMNTFDIYFTNLQGEIKQDKKDIYMYQLIEVIDRVVEYIPDYKDR